MNGMTGGTSADEDALSPLEMLALSYQRGAPGDRLRAMLLLDRRLGRAVIGAREEVLAQIKLAWWRDALAGSSRQPRGEPLVARLLALDLAGAAGRLIDGWEGLLVAERWDTPVIAEAAAARAAVIDPDDLNPGAARRWAAWDLALRCDSERAGAAWHWAAMAAALGGRWPRGLRGSALLAGLAAHELRASAVPRRPAGLGAWLVTLRLGLTGR